MRFALLLWLVSGVLSPGALAQSDLITEFNAAYRAYNTAYEKGAYGAAVPYAEKALELGEALLADQPEQLAMLTFNLGDTYHLAGRIESAIETLDLAVTRYEAAYGANGIAVAEPLAKLAEVLEDKSRGAEWKNRAAPMREARTAYKRILNLHELHYGRSDPRLTMILLQLAEVSKAFGNSRKATDQVERALYLVADAGPAFALAHSLTLQRLAKLKLEQGQLEEAAGQLQEALAVLKPMDAPPKKTVNDVHRLLVTVYTRMGDFDALESHIEFVRKQDPSTWPPGPVAEYRAQHRFPRKALERGISGTVVVGFDITKDGSVGNVKVLASNPSGIFDRYGIEAVEKYKYRHLKIDGEPREYKDNQIQLYWEVEGRPMPELDWKAPESKPVGVKVEARRRF